MNLKEWMKDGKKVRLIVAAGILVIALLFLSTFLPGKEPAGSGAAGEGQGQEQQALSNEAYEERYRKTVLALVKQIQGVGKAEVAVTLQSGVEYVYAREESKTADTQNSDDKRVSERNSLEQKTILIEDDNGNRKALLRTTLEPTVRGVVVVCEGGGDPVVVQQVTEAVKTALGIGANKVCVAPLSQFNTIDSKDAAE